MEERIENITFSDEDFADTQSPEEDRGDFDPAGDDAVAVARALTADSSTLAEARRAAKKEALRILLTEAMQSARKQNGLTQQDVAERLGVSQSWISKLESANYDHQIESVVAYLDAVGAELSISILTAAGPLRVEYKELAGGDDTDSVRAA